MQVVRRIGVVPGYACHQFAADEGFQVGFERVRCLLRIDLAAGDMQGKGLDVLRTPGGVFDSSLRPLVEGEPLGAFLLSFRDVILEGVELNSPASLDSCSICLSAAGAQDCCYRSAPPPPIHRSGKPESDAANVRSWSISIRCNGDSSHNAAGPTSSSSLGGASGPLQNGHLASARSGRNGTVGRARLSLAEGSVSVQDQASSDRHPATSRSP